MGVVKCWNSELSVDWGVDNVTAFVNQLEMSTWLMLRPLISRKGELNEWVLIAAMIKIKGVIEINGVVKAV